MRSYLLLIFLLFGHQAWSHSGGLDADGCHRNKKTGEYHCHKPKTDQPATVPQAKPVDVTVSENSNRVLQLDYQGFTVWLDCKEHAPIKFRYVAQRDTGNNKRYDTFMIDPNVPQECQQKSSAAYGKGYDRGHQVPANHLDNDPVAIKQSNFMTNILPQTSQMNRGAWLQTEEIVECYRDISELLVLGGVIWGNDTSNDLFVSSHGVRTPDYFYKVIIRGTGADERAIAWIVPNTVAATKKRLDDYLVSISELEKLTGQVFPVSDYAKHDKPSSSWLIPHGCIKS